MTSWRNENACCFWAVKLDARDLGGHLDVTQRALAGTQSSRVKEDTSHVIAVGAHGISTRAWDVCSKYLPAGLHGCECAAVLVTALSAFGSAVARAVWSKKLPMTKSDPALFVIWSRFRQLRRYLAYRPDEVDRVYRLLDYASTSSSGHGTVHLLLDSALEIGLSWDSTQAGWVRSGLSPLRMMTGPIQHFRRTVWQAWQGKAAIDLCKRKGFRGQFCVDVRGSHQLPNSSHLRERDKMFLRATHLGVFAFTFALLLAFAQHRQVHRHVF